MATIEVPPIPHKSEIIPIHASDRSVFKRCRRRWNWSSPSRANLQQRVDINGVYFPFWFGGGIHYALEQYYHPIVKRDPVEAYLWWFTLQWEGGVVTEEELQLTYDRRPELQMETQNESTLWRVRGLRDIHPMPDADEFDEYKELGVKMMEYYRDYAERHDNFEVIAAEASFSVPLGFSAVDPRDGLEKEVHARGKRDAIIYDRETGMFGILEHKSAVSIDDAYFTKLEKDEQCSTYMWASEEEAKLHDLPYKEIHFVLYNAVRKGFPRPPTMLSSNKPSLDRQKESTTAELFDKFIAEHGLGLWFNNNVKAQEYRKWLGEIGEANFVRRDLVRRNRHEIRSVGDRIKMEAQDMLDPNLRIYPNPTSDWWCGRCPFRAPCLATDDGSDPDFILEQNYETNPTR